MSEQKVPRSVEKRIVIKFLVGGRDVFSNEEFDHNALFHAPRYLLFAHHSSNPRQDWTGSNPSRREGGGCGFTLSRSHSCCAVRLVYIQISPGYIWTTLYNSNRNSLYRFLLVLTLYVSMAPSSEKVHHPLSIGALCQQTAWHCGENNTWNIPSCSHSRSRELGGVEEVILFSLWLDVCNTARAANKERASNGCSGTSTTDRLQHIQQFKIKYSNI